MLSSQRSGEGVTSRSRKRSRTGTKIPPTPSVLRGQTQWFGAKVLIPVGTKWYKSHTETKYFSDVVLEDENLERYFPDIKHCLLELHSSFKSLLSAMSALCENFMQTGRRMPVLTMLQLGAWKFL